MSIHEKDRWPRTGHLEECKKSNLINIPVPEKFNDTEMMYVTENLVYPFGQNLKPDLVILQAGTDCLEDDPQSKMCLSNYSYWRTISKLKNITKKTLVLGGGGYNPNITAKHRWKWLVLNSKEHLLDTNLNNECQNLLRSLAWKNSRVRSRFPRVGLKIG